MKNQVRWPTPTDYQDALRHPARCFTDLRLARGTVAERTAYDAPLPIAGQFAHVYRIRVRIDEETEHSWAVRLFLRDAADRAARYAAIYAHLRTLSHPSLVGFTYEASGFRLPGKERIFPCVSMDWATGDPLHAVIEANLDTPAFLAALLEQFIALCSALESMGIAHGDLQHDNLLVRPGRAALRLLDYDGMFVPALRGRPAAEVGHPAYQHPQRDRTHFAPGLDRFAALSIAASLAVLREAPALWYRFHNGDNLLFRHPDYLAPQQSPTFREARHGARRSLYALRLLSALETACHNPDPLALPPVWAV